MDELTFIDWLRHNGAGDLSDDCALIDSSSDRSPLAVTTDMLLDGTHFVLAEHGARAVGIKAIACSLSDIAAMGCLPAAAFCAGGLPVDMSPEPVQELFLGACSICEEFGVVIAGGDTTAWPRGGRLVISVTMLGWADGVKPIRRSGAQPGDAILVTGRLGGSQLGKHLDFTPRVKEARHLAERGDVHAMIDISDGLATDLAHITQESNCGACIEADRVPVSDAAVETAKNSGRPAFEHALCDGEDFELLLTMPAAVADELLDSWQFDTELTRIGSVEETGLSVLHRDGSRSSLSGSGYVHKFGKDT